MDYKKNSLQMKKSLNLIILQEWDEKKDAHIELTELRNKCDDIL